MAVSPYGSIMKAPATLAETVAFTTSGTFSKADYPGLKYVRVRCLGGGGAGGGSSSNIGTTNASVGTGGAGGDYAESVVYADDLAASETVTVGAGGTGAVDANGGGGGNSSFGTHAVASGGLGGSKGLSKAVPHSSETTPGGGPQAGTIGDFVIGGSGGGAGYAVGGGNHGGHGGEGGTSGFGGSPGTNRSGGAVGTGTSSSGRSAGQRGAGGSGSISRNDQGAGNGGDGGAGLVMVDVYVQEQGLVGDTGFVHPNQFVKDEAWTPFTPTFVNATATVTTARYLRSGKICHVYFLLSDFNPTGSWCRVDVPLPFAVDFPSYHPLNGVGYAYDGSANAVYLQIVERYAGQNQVGFLSTSGAAARVGTGVPFTWAATGDSIRASFSYPIDG